MEATVTLDQCRAMWDKYNAYKERAEQHEFIDLMMIDMRFTPLIADLENHWDPNHGRLFVNAMQKVLDHFGIR